MCSRLIVFIQDGQYFLGVVGQEEGRINALCKVAETYMQGAHVPDEGISCVLC